MNTRGTHRSGRARLATLGILVVGALATAVALGSVGSASAHVAALLASRDTCNGQTLLSQIKARHVLRVAAGTGPPNTFPDVRTGAWEGTNSKILGAVAKQIGVKVKASFGPVGSLVPAIQSGRADVTTGLFQNAQRAQVADFSLPFQWSIDSVFVKASDNSIHVLDDLKGKSLGAASGTAELAEAQLMENAGYGSGISISQLAAGPLDLLADGRVDAIVVQNITAQYAKAHNPSRYNFRAAFPVPQAYYGTTGNAPGSYFLVNKTPCNTTLLDAINATITQLQKSGTMAKIFRSYGITDRSVYTPPTP